MKDSFTPTSLPLVTPAAARRAPDGGAPASRRAFLGAMMRSAGALLVVPLAASRLAAENRPLATAGGPDAAGAADATAVAMTVYKDPSCGCCKEWVKHMQKAGFTATAQDTADMDSVKKRLGVPPTLASCHTAVIGDYLVEGHVPADVVQIMLKEKPTARGLAVPGMPSGSPGMEGPVKQKYDVMLFERSGKARVYASR